MEGDLKQEIECEREINEDFELIEIKKKNNIYKFFHKLIRRKYYNRIKKKYKSKEKKKSKFKIIKNMDDYYQDYKKTFQERKIFHQKVDNELFKKLGKKIRTEIKKEISSKEKNRKEYSLELDQMVNEFKIQINELIDFYNRAEIYKIINFENMKIFYDFNIKYNNIKDIMIPFLLSKLFNRINHISSKIFNKFFIIILSKLIKSNISTWTLFLPELDFININNYIGQKVEYLLFSKLFNKQKKQLLFMFTNLNQILHEYIVNLEKLFFSFYSQNEPLSFSDYKKSRVKLNEVFIQINTINFPKSKNQQFNINQICDITDFNYKKELKKIKNQQESIEKEKSIYTFSLKNKEDKDCKKRVDVKPYSSYNKKLYIKNFDLKSKIEKEKMEIKTFSFKKTDSPFQSYKKNFKSMFHMVD